jgi:hypothetical protein
MRDIKFRGLEVLTGDWVFGNHVLKGTGSHYILPQNLVANDIPQYHVDGDTVGQNTGLKDKNGKAIYEGDIVTDEENFVGPILYEDGSFKVHCIDLMATGHLFGQVSKYLNIIGNIYENPELLEDHDGGLLKSYESGTL